MKKYTYYLGLESTDGKKWEFLEALNSIIAIAHNIGIDGLTCYQTIGMWLGKKELSVKIELFHSSEQIAVE